EDAGVRRRVGAWRVADGLLIDVDHLVNVLQSLDGIVRRADGAGAIQLPGQRIRQDIIDERTLARAAHASNSDQGSEGKRDVDVLEVVMSCSAHREAWPVLGQFPDP